VRTEDGVAADVAVVRHVRVRHEQVAVANRRRAAAAGGAAVDGDELADLISPPDFGLGGFALVLQILRRHADRAVRIEDIILADPGGTLHVHIGHQARSGCYLDASADDAVGPNLGCGGNVRAGIDDSGRMC